MTLNASPAARAFLDLLIALDAVTPQSLQTTGVVDKPEPEPENPEN